jgi:holo-ACP synthase / triphosphoribosyl-dephospho-CoA synthase
MNVDEIRNRILNAREKRASLRQQCSQAGCGSLGLSLNIPGYPKTTTLFSDFFTDVLSDLKQFLQAHGAFIDTTHELRQIDEAGDFYLLPLQNGQPLNMIKGLAESFEKHHVLGRIIDIDIADRQLQPVSSGKLKQCLLCEQPAILCMREANHPYEELREYIVHGIDGYLSDRTKKRTCMKLAAFALKAILYEISVSPKPGLVGRFEQGAHTDMDYFTFIASTSVLAGHFEELAALGYSFQGKDFRGVLPAIRVVGLKMEDAMFSATHGVNTQKGLIFLIGLALFSAAHCIAQDGEFAAVRCRETIAAICTNLVKNELMMTTGNDRTHGKDCFERYGSEGGGIRKEAEDGLPSVFEQGMPELKSVLAGAGKAASAEQLNKALVNTLLRLMSVANDTNILHRKDIQTLKTIQQMAQRVLDAGDSEDGAERYARLLSFCQREHVSPGGSADLLAITVFLFFVEQSFSVLSEHQSTV